MEQAEATIDPVFVEWTDLSMLVARDGGTEGLYWWMCVVGSDGTTQDRLVRGRTAWARWGEVWKKKLQETAQAAA